MKKFNCECCGASLPIPKKFNRYIKCSYCDATYEIENNKQIQDISLPELKYILVEPGHLQKYKAEVIIDKEFYKYYPKEVLNKYIKEQLTHNLVDFLMDKIDIQKEEDIENLGDIYYTTIRLDTRIY